jgi:EEF1A lysine methyltransferase 1
VFDFDQKFNKDPGFVFYDFNKPEDIPAELHSYFDMVVIDPPFITREVWEKVIVPYFKLVVFSTLKPPS